MRTNAMLAALLALPVLMMGCNRQDQSPAAATRGEDRQATAPSTQDQMLQDSPPAAGTQSDSSGAPPSSEQGAPSSAAPANRSAPALPGDARRDD